MGREQVRVTRWWCGGVAGEGGVGQGGAGMAGGVCAGPTEFLQED